MRIWAMVIKAPSEKKPIEALAKDAMWPVDAPR